MLVLKVIIRDVKVQMYSCIQKYVESCFIMVSTWKNLLHIHFMVSALDILLAPFLES
jgi:hypothetical protein